MKHVLGNIWGRFAWKHEVAKGLTKPVAVLLTNALLTSCPLPGIERTRTQKEGSSLYMILNICNLYRGSLHHTRCRFAQK